MKPLPHKLFACIREWDLKDDDPRINPNGGAIALGHPLGVSGTRILQTAAIELKKQNKKFISNNVYWSWTRIRNNY